MNLRPTFRSLTLVAGLAAGFTTFAQVSIRNATPAPPDVRAVFDLDWGGGVNPVLGILAPRMTAAQRAAIGGAANSLLVYQTDVNTPHGYWFYDSALPTPAWVRVGQGTPWTLGGNTGTNVATNYIGTNNAQSLRITTNNVQLPPRITVHPTGQVGVNLAAAPTEQMEVAGAIRITGTSNVTPSAGSIRYNATTGAHDGNIDGTATWYQLENVFGSRVKQDYYTQPVSACVYPAGGVATWPLIDDLAFTNGSSSSTLEVPYSVFWEDGRHQYLYRSQDLVALNICPGTNINQIAFNVTALANVAPQTRVNFAKIRMKNTPTAALNTFEDNALLTCADYGPIATQVITGWNAHNLNVSPFQWTGAPFNMLVDFAFDNQDWTLYPFNPQVEFENTNYNATFGMFCDACGSLFVPGTCFWGTPVVTAGTCGSNAVPGTPPSPGPAAAGNLYTCWNHTSGSAPQPWSPAPIFTTTTNTVTCDGTFQFTGGFVAASKRPTLRLYAQSSAVAPVLKRGQYLFAQDGVTIGTAAWATSGAYPNQVFRGPGTIAAQVGVWGGSVLLSDHVFDKYYEGTTKPEDAKQAAGYEHYPVDGMIQYVKEYRHLPTIDGRERWNENGPFSTDHLTNQLWVTVEEQSLYIKELNERMDALQKYLVEKRLQELKKN